MKKFIKIIAVIMCLVSLNVNGQIKLTNPYSLTDPNGNFLHNHKFGGLFGSIAVIEYVEAEDRLRAKNLVESFKLMKTPKLIVDSNGVSNGNPTNGGTTWRNSLLFGRYTGELISSKRTGGNGRWGLDFATLWKNRMHIGNDGSIGVGTTNGQSPTTSIDGRFNIHNFNSGENNFYKNINLYTSAQYDGTSDRVGIANHISDGTLTSPITINTLYSEIATFGFPPSPLPNNTIGINNNMRNYTAPEIDDNPIYTNWTYGIINDLNDKKIALRKFCPNPPYCNIFYQPRVGILNVTNTDQGSIDNISLGSGKIGIWNINEGGYSVGTPRLYDGWAQWNDGQTFLRYGYVTASDQKLKSKITPVKQNDVLKKIQLLKPVTYEFKKRPGIVENGFLAQDLQKVFPEIVAKSINPVTKEELLGVQYQQLHSIQVAAIQAQQKLIEKLEKRVSVLEKQIKR